MMCPLPKVNKAYAMILGDKSQKMRAAIAGDLGPSPDSTNFDIDLHPKTLGGLRSYNHGSSSGV